MLSTILQLGKPSTILKSHQGFGCLWGMTQITPSLPHAIKTQIRNIVYIHKLVQVVAMTYLFRMEFMDLNHTPKK